MLPSESNGYKPGAMPFFDEDGALHVSGWDEDGDDDEFERDCFDDEDDALLADLGFPDDEFDDDDFDGDCLD